MKSRVVALTLVCIFCLSAPSLAEIEKVAIPTESGISFFWWPKLTIPERWHQDKEYSFHYKANALAPAGKTFANAETVIYAKALYKNREKDITSLEQLIEKDRRAFLLNSPESKIQKIDDLKNSNGRILQSYTFFPKSVGNWERVAYGEEKEYYLIFTVSSRTKKGYDNNIKTYENLVSEYRE